MASKKTHDVVATVGTYKDRQSGEDKKRYQNVGSAFTDDDGRISIKLDAVPVGPEWSGWLSLYLPKDDRGQARQERRDSAPSGNRADTIEYHTDIPF